MGPIARVEIPFQSLGTNLKPQPTFFKEWGQHGEAGRVRESTDSEACALQARALVSSL